VDVNGGAGSHFRAIQPALDAASPGDTIFVRAGQYEPCATSKGVRLYGEPGAAMMFWGSGPDAIAVSNLPAGATFALKGFDLMLLNAPSSSPVRLTNCAGRVHVDGMRLAGVPYSNRGSPALAIQNCPQVTVANSRLTGKPALLCNGSAVALTGCKLQGQSAGFYEGRLAWGSETAVRGNNARIYLAWSETVGGHGAVSSTSGYDASPATILDNCSVVVSGDADALVAAGNVPAGRAPTSAIVANLGELWLDPTVRVQPGGNAPPILGNTTLTLRRLPVLRAGFAPWVLGVELFAQNGDPYFLFAALPADRALPPFAIGELWCDPATVLVFDRGVIGASERRVVQLPLAPLPALAGLPLALGAVRLTSGPIGLELPNPVVLALY
jgi:hypothetical protein